MVTRENRDFVRATLAIQQADPAFQSMAAAKQQTVQLLGVQAPSDADFKKALAEPPARRARGRPTSVDLTKRDAVAAVAVYFESIGAGAEQAIIEAQKWLNIELSRRVAKEAVTKFKANTSPDQFKPQAMCVFQIVRQGTTQALPMKMDKVRKKRRAKSDLG
jgi:hypothetical protein